MKSTTITSSINDKYPKLYKAGSYVAEVWAETFPNEKKNSA